MCLVAALYIVFCKEYRLNNSPKGKAAANSPKGKAAAEDIRSGFFVQDT